MIKAFLTFMLLTSFATTYAQKPVKQPYYITDIKGADNSQPNKKRLNALISSYKDKDSVKRKLKHEFPSDPKIWVRILVTDDQNKLSFWKIPMDENKVSQDTPPIIMQSRSVTISSFTEFADIFSDTVLIIDSTEVTIRINGYNMRQGGYIAACHCQGDTTVRNVKIPSDRDINVVRQSDFPDCSKGVIGVEWINDGNKDIFLARGYVYFLSREDKQSLTDLLSYMYNNTALPDDTVSRTLYNYIRLKYTGSIDPGDVDAFIKAHKPVK